MQQFLCTCIILRMEVRKGVKKFPRGEIDVNNFVAKRTPWNFEKQPSLLRIEIGQPEVRSEVLIFNPSLKTSMAFATRDIQPMYALRFSLHKKRAWISFIQRYLISRNFKAKLKRVERRRRPVMSEPPNNLPVADVYSKNARVHSAKGKRVRLAKNEKKKKQNKKKNQWYFDEPNSVSIQVQFTHASNHIVPNCSNCNSNFQLNGCRAE